jgi:hypothetical protein
MPRHHCTGYVAAPPDRTTALLARYRAAHHASQQATTAIARTAQATGASSRVLTTARTLTRPTPTATPGREPDEHATLAEPRPGPQVAGPLQHTLLTLGVTSPRLLARGADLDHASQGLLIEAADHLPPGHTRPSATTMNNTAAAAELLNHALASGSPHATQLLRQPAHQHDQQPVTQPQPQAEP